MPDSSGPDTGAKYDLTEPKYDLHVHTSNSDGLESPEQVLARARRGPGTSRASP